MNTTVALSQLRNSLARLYDDEMSARRVVMDAGLDSRRIAFSGRATNNWHAILAEASKVGKVDDIVQVALTEYGGNRELLTAFKAYQEAGQHRLATKSTLPSHLSQRESPQIFISYGREDTKAALDLYHRLKATGFRPWIDQEDILPGEEWDLKLRNTLRQADFLIVCLSRHSAIRRGTIQREIKMALDVADEMPEGSIFLIPVRLEDCEVPSRLAKYQYVDLFSDTGFDRLVRAIMKQWEKEKIR